MLFEEMLPLLKSGKKAINFDWNGSEMFIFVSKMWNNTIENPIITPFIVMQTEDKRYVPWTPSQPDLFSKNWEIMNDDKDVLEL
jgi:hypothetical protein